VQINIIHNSDCIKGMESIESGSIDAIVTDPPYGIDFQCCHRSKEDRFTKIANDKKPFVEWLPEAFRVLKNTGAMYCFCRWDVRQAFMDTIEDSGFQIQDEVIWDRVIHGMGDLERKHGPRHDTIIFATKGNFKFPGKRPHSVITEPDFIELAKEFNLINESIQNGKIDASMVSVFTSNIAKLRDKKADKHYDSHGIPISGFDTEFASVLRESRVQGLKLNHPNEKPVRLIQRLICNLTNENDIVLDPFMGSGTTARAAQLTNRNFIGFELDSNYVQHGTTTTNEIANPDQLGLF